MYDLRIEVEEVKGFCDLPMKKGDYFEIKGGRIMIPEGKYICLWALQSMMPVFPAKQRKIDEENDWIPHTKRFCCPDPNGMVIFRIDQINPDTGRTVVEDEKQVVPPRIIVEEDLCTGCRACETVCSFTHSENFNGEEARIQIEKIEEEGRDIPHICRQCGNAPCVKVCPAGALSRDPETNAVLVNQELCTGCQRCAGACSFDAIHFHQEIGLPLICDLCEGEIECINRCPVDAIKFGTAEKLKEL